jgi:hypothetical protein
MAPRTKNKHAVKARELMELLGLDAIYCLANGTFYTTLTAVKAANDGNSKLITEYKKSDK